MKNKSQNRRDFIRKSASMAAGMIIIPQIVPASALGRNGSVAPSDRIVMGGIGVGSMGTGDMKNFLKSKEVQYVAVCDVDKKHRDRATKLIGETYGTNDARSYNNYEEFLDKEKLDAIHLALPDHWHAIPAIEAAKKGLHMYGQKPLARSIVEGRAIADAVKKYNVVWQTGSQQRSNDRFRFACELVRNGILGEVDFVEVGLPNGGKSKGMPEVQPVPEGVDWERWLGPAPKVPFRGVLHWDWRWILDYSGGQLTDWAGHHIDIAHWGLDLERTGPVKIKGKGEYLKNDIFNVPYAYDIECEYANGLEMRIANASKFAKRKGKGWDGRKKDNKFGMGAVWYGENGWLQVNRSGIWSDNPDILNTDRDSLKIKLYESKEHHQNFLDCVKSGKETIAPAEVGFRSISVALLGEIAMTTGDKLKWDPDAEKFTNSDEANDLLLKPYRKPWVLPKV